MKTHIPWRPMDTAPKDGTYFLVINEDKLVHKVWYKKGLFMTDYYNHEAQKSLTGWLPLPDEKGFEVPGIETFPPEVLPKPDNGSFLSVEVLVMIEDRLFLGNYCYDRCEWRIYNGGELLNNRYTGSFRWYYPPVTWKEAWEKAGCVHEFNPVSRFGVKNADYICKHCCLLKSVIDKKVKGL